MIKKYSLVLITFLCSFYGFAQISEGFETGMPTSYTNGNITLSSGTWNAVQVIRGTTGVNTGSYSCQIRSQTNAQIVSPIISSGGLGTVSFYARSSTTSGSLQVNYRINGGAWTPATGSPFAINSTITQYTATINSGANDIEFQLRRTASTVYIDDVLTTTFSTCTPPADPNGGITGTTPSCNSTTLTYTGTDTTPLLLLNYWQTSASGTDQTNEAINTYNATSTGTYYVRKYDVAADCWSDNSVSYNVVIDASSPVITTQPANQNETLPNTATFDVVTTSDSNETYQWQINTGSGWVDVSTGTGGLTSSYTTETTSASMNGYLYRCLITNTCGISTSNSATLTLSNSSPNNATGIVGCFEDTSVILNWNAPGSGATPDGYVVFARTGGVDPNGITGDASAYNGFNADFSLAPTASAALGRYVYKGAATTATITGLTEDANYSFTVYAYRGETLTGWAGGGTNGSTVTNGLAQADVRNFTTTPNNNQLTLNWLRPTPLSCWDDILIVANQGAVVFTPTGDGSAYTANSVYSTPNQVVYKGSATSAAITGLTNGTQYCFRAFVRRGTTWTLGVEVCGIPAVTYCDSFGDSSDTFLTNVTQVQFNTINNSTSPSDSGYTDFTAMSTNVNLGEGYNLSVNVNTDGAYNVYSRVWIDWNNDGDFNDSGEEYDMGSAFDDVNAATTNSPLNVEVPVTAAIGTTRMRVSARYDQYATSCQEDYDGEVEDYTINIQQSSNAEINIKGNNITIANGFNAPYGLNNTLFGATDLGNTSPAKVFNIQNIGLANLNLSGSPIVDIVGTNPGDFNVSIQPSSTNLTSYSIENFSIEFSPTADGIRTAIVSISNSDSDENPYTFTIQGTGNCATTVTSTIWPAEGPINTEVTITSSGNNLTGATASLNGVALTTVSNSTTELIVQLPSGVASGNLVTTLSTGCSSTNPFAVLDTLISGCETGSGATTPSDLFISEVTDATSNSSTLIEIFNGTGNTVNLTDYQIRIYNNGSSSATNSITLLGTLANNATYVLDIGTTSCTYNNITITPDQNIPGIGGINFDLNGADAIVLEKVSGSAPLGPKDSFGLFGSNNWANSLSFGTDGVNCRRINTATPLPSGLAFDINDWDVIDWTNCADSDYVDLGVYDFSVGIPPEITVNPMSSNTNCDISTQLTVAGNEGVSGGLGLAYRWYYLAPNSSTWTEITSNTGPHTGFDQATLTISFTDALDVDGYQYYCQVRENGSTCYSASNATKINMERSIWNGSVWSSAPDISKIAIIDGNYTTGVNGGANGNINACQLIINPTRTVIVNNTSFVRVVTNVINNGILTVHTRGSFVQDGDGASAGTFVNNGSGTSNVNKTTDTFDSSTSGNYNYTYWSSPVIGSNVMSVFPNPHGNRRYYFAGENYLDETQESGNNNGTAAGQDDIDDNGDDWQNATSSMDLGRGYAVTAVTPPMPGALYSDTANFIGDFNTGDVLVDVFKNDTENNDNNWNFIGNPYPSSISASEFLTENTFLAANPGAPLQGAIFLWSQGLSANANNNGNEALNFSQNDYAIINGVMGTAGGNGVSPDPYIPSGQGFFIAYEHTAPEIDANGSIKRNQVRFMNSMRELSNNGQFFEANGNSLGDQQRSAQSSNFIEGEKLWLNLNSDNGVFSQIGVAYTGNATNGYDGWYFDAPRNLSTNTYSILYTLIENSDKKFAIQGKNSSALDLEETIPLGFKTIIEDPTIYSFSISDLEGEFLENNTIYVRDLYLDITHNLSESNYSFTSEVGEFNDRFEIVFTQNPLSTEEFEVDDNALSIIENSSGLVTFKLSGLHTMESIEIIDVLGKVVYNLNASSSSQKTFNLSKLSQSTYIAKVTLDNGYVITKKAIKRK